MSWFSKSCGPCRADLCLLASGALADHEQARLEKHLAACPDCRKHYDEINLLAAPLAQWEEAFSAIEPDDTVRGRWAKHFQAALEPIQPPRSTLLDAFFDWCRDLIWPCRRIWTGFAAIWLVILAVDLSLRDTESEKSSRPSSEMVRAFLKSEGFLPEFANPAKSRVARPPQPALPQPRSERTPEISRT